MRNKQEEWIADTLATESFNIIAKQGDRLGRNVTFYLVHSFLESFITEALFDIFDKVSVNTQLKTDRRRYEVASGEFSAMKGLIREAIENSFSNVMSEISGQDVDYCCEISTMPEPINKEMI